MFIRKLVAVAALALAPLVASAAEPANPYKNAKKGEWISYKAAISAMGLDLTGTIKQTVTETTDKAVTIEVTGNVNGMDIPAQKQVIDLTKPFNPLGTANIPGGAEAKIEKKESGKEKIKVGDKELEAEWTTYKVSADLGGMKLDADVKTWFATGVGIGGMVKQEMKSQQFNVTMELEKSGKD